MSETPAGRRILLLRHSERIDRTFASMGQWQDKSFEPPRSIYKRQDLNFPRVLPVRSAEYTNKYDVGDYFFDVPLTQMGEASAEQLGYHTSVTRWKYTAAYSSPSLRCLQTATRYLTGLQNGDVNIDHLLPLKVESGLFDFCGFNEYSFSGIPTFLGAEWLSKRGIMISTDHVPSMLPDHLVVGEDVKSFYGRVEMTLKQILQENNTPHPKYGPPSILIATHAPVVDAACQILLRQPIRDDERLKNVANYLKYIGTLALEEEASGKWRLIPSPVRTFRWSSNEKFDYKKIFKDAFPGGDDED